MVHHPIAFPFSLSVTGRWFISLSRASSIQYPSIVPYSFWHVENGICLLPWMIQFKPQFTFPHVLSYFLQRRKAMLKHMNSCQPISGKPWIFNSENGNINFRKILLDLVIPIWYWILPSGECILWPYREDNYDCHFSNMTAETSLKMLGDLCVVFRVNLNACRTLINWDDHMAMKHWCKVCISVPLFTAARCAKLGEIFKFSWLHFPSVKLLSWETWSLWTLRVKNLTDSVFMITYYTFFSC